MSCEPEEEVVCKNLGEAVQYILDVFEDYAEDDKISEEDFLTLLEEEFPDSECKKKIDEVGLDKVLSKIDRKGDGVNIKEYSRLIKFLITGKFCRNKEGGRGKGKRRRRGKGGRDRDGGGGGGGGGGKGKGKCQDEEDE